jgi:hypothetical protein
VCGKSITIKQHRHSFLYVFVQYCVMDILFVVYGWEIGPGRGQSVQHSGQTASRAVGKSNKKAEVIYCALLSNFNMYEATVNSFVSVKTNLDDQSCLKFWIFKWYVSPKNRLKENWHFYFHLKKTRLLWHSIQRSFSRFESLCWLRKGRISMVNQWFLSYYRGLQLNAWVQRRAHTFMKEV